MVRADVSQAQDERRCEVNRTLGAVASLCSALAVVFAVLGLLVGAVGSAKGNPPQTPPTGAQQGCGSFGAYACTAPDEESCAAAGTTSCATITLVNGDSCKCKWKLDIVGPARFRCGCFPRLAG
jgi:hypothetical protein